MVRWILRGAAATGLVLFAALLTAAAGPQVSTSIIFPQEGATVSTASVPVVVSLSGLTVDCGRAGKALQAGVGHWHVILDGGLVDMACGPGYLLSLLNVKPGTHTVMAVPAQNNHMELKEAAAKVSFTYQPAVPPATAKAVSIGTPAVSIAVPKNGTSVSGASFPLVMNVRNFRLSCELFGKPQVAGTGHWHVHLDTMAPGMAGMATMMAMGCSNSFDVSLRGIPAGRHTFIVVLTDNLHAPIQPMVTARVTVTVK